MKKLAVCIFGLNRSLSITHNSILNNVIEPLKSRFLVDVFAGINLPKQNFTNIRSNEKDVKIEVDSLSLLPLKKIISFEQEEFDFINFEQQNVLLNIADAYGDQHQSSKNIFRSLFAYQISFNLASTTDDFDYFLFLRPDLFYIDKFDAERLFTITISNQKFYATPNWQQWDGLNDRIGFCDKQAAQILSQRLYHVKEFCETQHLPLHSETSLRIR